MGPGEKGPGRLRASCCVSKQELAPNKGVRMRTHTQHFFALSDIITLALDGNHDKWHIPVTFCHEFVRRFPLERHGKNTELQ